jgi:outer membrane protein insertion porin family
MGALALALAGVVLPACGPGPAPTTPAVAVASGAASAEPTPPAKDSVDVVLRVTEGPRTLVAAIRVEGLAVVPEPSLRAELATTVGEALSQAAVDRDALVIAAAGYDRGLVEIRVDPVQIVELAGGDSAEVIFRVAEGPVYHLGKLEVTGEGALAAREYRDALKKPAPGSVFSRQALLGALARVRAVHERRGAPVEVTPESEIDAKQRRVDVRFRIGAAGPKP